MLLFVGLQEQYRNYLLTYQIIEDDVKSVRITLEALFRDISRITTGPLPIVTVLTHLLVVDDEILFCI